MHTDQRTVARYKGLTDLLNDNGYRCAWQITEAHKVFERHVECYTGPKGAILVTISYPVKNRRTDYTEAALCEIFLPATTENSTNAEQRNLRDFFDNGRPEVSGGRVESMSLEEASNRESRDRVAEYNRNNPPVVEVGNSFECEAYDLEEKKWMKCVVTRSAVDQYHPRTSEDDITWSATWDDLKDHKQFRNFVHA